jgi:hypothetical protein
MIAINYSVGAAGVNKPVDVMIVQHLLNLNRDVANYQTRITGMVDGPMTQAIERFQQNALGMKRPDGKVDPGGNTFARLVAPKLGWIISAPAVRARLRADLWAAKKKCEVLRSVIGASRQSRVATRLGEASSSLSIIQQTAFLKLYDLQFGILGAAARAGLTKLIDYINADLEICDVGWCAYMLATVKHECHNKWESVREETRGAGQPYGMPASCTANGKKYAQTYYGRGYAQLTWLQNYLTLGQALGLGDDLATNPDKALNPDIAYQVLSYGMRNGSFSPGHALSTYINARTCDYLGARQIINLQDHADLIQGYAENLEMLLRVCCSGSFSDSPARGFVGIGSQFRLSLW